MKTLREALTKEYLKRLEEMAIRLKYRLSTDGYSGARRSMAKGSSLEFSDYREYAAGDDLRRVDWNGFARFGKLYLKLFLEEKQASVHVFLDCSRSMEQDGKFLAAKKLAHPSPMWDFAAAIRCICLPLGIPSEHRSGIWHKRDAFWKPWIFWTNWKQSGGLRLCPQPWDAALCGGALPL